MTKEKILVLSVDRDNDIGEKTDFRGPLVGREKVLEAAKALGLADPGDSDFNAMFEAVRVLGELGEGYEAEVAVVTGDRSVGIKSDREIGEQLRKVLEGFRASGVILVTDGSEDEHVMPLIQSRAPVISVKRVIVKQSEQLESGYYKIMDFLERSLESPKMARLIFGLPAVILILLGLFGLEGMRFVVGLLGIYLLIKGFKLERYFEGAWEELKTSFTRRRFAFFMYIVAIVFGILAVFRGYTVMLDYLSIGLFESIASFLGDSIYIFWLTGSVAWIGRNIGLPKRKGRRVAVVPIFGLAISIVVFSASQLIIMPEYPFTYFIFAIIVGFALLFLALFIERRG